jgi:hypothetical protein
MFRSFCSRLSYQQLYKSRRPLRGGDEVGARRKDIYSFDVIPIKDEAIVWSYSLQSAAPSEPAVEMRRPVPTDADGLRRFELLARVNARLAALAPS